jgi:hypothetical protein
MKTVLLAVHAVAVLAVVGSCAFQAYLAVDHYGAESIALTYSRIAVSALCGSYAIAHVVLLLKRRVAMQALLWFYPLCALLVVLADVVAHGYGKHWAPADSVQAIGATVIGTSIVAALSLAAAFSCYRAWVSGGAHGA